MVLLLLACADPPPEGAFEVATGSYLARPPEGEIRGTLLWFHGYNQAAEVNFNNSALQESANEAGWLTVFPVGLDDSWDTENSPGGGGRDEMAFIDEVLDDVEARYGLVSPVVTGGGSHGASLPYQLLCESDRVDVGNTIMGTFWEPIPTSCAGSKKDLRHVHGLGDTTWPYPEGRAFWGTTKQGDVPEAMGMWREHLECAQTSAVVDEGWDAECELWDCGDHEVRLCLHQGGHSKPSGWVDRMISWVQERS
jgi:polyhydroxybutyrate depolymerase